jgi:hypothetical protein
MSIWYYKILFKNQFMIKFMSNTLVQIVSEKHPKIKKKMVFRTLDYRLLV